MLVGVVDTFLEGPGEYVVDERLAATTAERVARFCAGLITRGVSVR